MNNLPVILIHGGLIPFKWRHYRRNISRLRRLGKNKCVFFDGTDSQNLKYDYMTLGEKEILQEVFDKERVAVSGTQDSDDVKATRSNFTLYHNDTEWLVFSGHGVDFESFFHF